MVEEGGAQEEGAAQDGEEVLLEEEDPAVVGWREQGDLAGDSLLFNVFLCLFAPSNVFVCPCLS